MSIYKRGEWWWLYVTDPATSRRIRRPTGERQRARAQRIHDEFKAELWKRRQGGRTLFGALDTWAEGKGYPDRKRVEKLKRLVRDQSLDELDTEGLLAAIPQKTPGTFNRYLNVLSAAGIKLAIDGARVKPKKGAAVGFRWLTADEWKKLRKELPEWQVPMADVAISTGLRQANVMRMRWEWVDLRQRVLWVPAAVMKANKDHRVKLAPEAYRAIKAQQGKHAEWVFVSEKDAEQPPSEIKTGWRAAFRRAKVPYARWHDLRHTWATWHLLNRTPLAVLKELGGWSDMRMVMRYAHMAESHADQYAGNAKPYQPRHNSRHKAA